MSTHLVQLQTPAKPSAFDAHHPPEKDLIEDCVHCGFCLPACPTYVLWGEEMDSPRGRIYMMKKAASGETELGGRFAQHMDNCLGCMACMTACPSGVQYNKLIEATRAQQERNVPRPFGESMFRRMLFATFPYASRMRWLSLPLKAYQQSGLQKLMRGSGLLKLLPARLRSMEALMPTVPRRLFSRLPASIAAQGGKRLRVGMLEGCVQQAFFSHVNEATAHVLAAEGCEVIIPQQQECCGALMVHCGLENDALSLARKMIASFEAANVDIVVINAAGCGSTMKEYGHLLRDYAGWSARAAAFSAKCKDISEVLCSLEPRAERHPLPMRVAYHDACHLQHAQGIRNEPRKLLRGIPGMDVAEIPEASLCCGSAGVYNLLHPEPAEELGDRKVKHLLTTQAQAVVSANPGCLLQLMSSLRRNGQAEMPAFHMVELLSASIRNLPVEALLRNDKSLSDNMAPKH